MTKDENDEVMAMSQAYRDSVKESEATIQRLTEQLKAFEPQPIATAPVDGTAILTDCGVVVGIFVVFGELQTRWVLVDISRGLKMTSRDGDYWTVSPKLWAPLPNWVAN